MNAQQSVLILTAGGDTDYYVHRDTSLEREGDTESVVIMVKSDECVYVCVRASVCACVCV